MAVPTAKEAAKWGLTVKEASGPDIDVWPENMAPVNLFIQVSTQWRMGPAGPSGLDYNVLPPNLRPGAAMTPDERELFESLRTMEVAALNQMRVK